MLVFADAGSGTSTKTRVLVVEDDRASRSALMALLRLTGFEPLPAGTVAEGLALLSQSPQFLLLDLMLPDGNGSTVLEYIRKNELPICVAVTTGAIDWEAMLKSRDVPDAMFPKPLDFQRVIAWLNNPAN